MSSVESGISVRRDRGPKKRKKSPFAGLPGIVDPTSGKVGQPLDPYVPKTQQVRKRNREILRRQILLRHGGRGAALARAEHREIDRLRRCASVITPAR